MQNDGQNNAGMDIEQIPQNQNADTEYDCFKINDVGFNLAMKHFMLFCFGLGGFISTVYPLFMTGSLLMDHHPSETEDLSLIITGVLFACIFSCLPKKTLDCPSRLAETIGAGTFHLLSAIKDTICSGGDNNNDEDNHPARHQV